MIAATISEVYQPIERFLAQTERAVDPPPEVLSPLDAFLLLQVARLLPQPPQVIDLAAAATAGTTAVIWASNRQAIHAAQIVGDTAFGRSLEGRLQNLGLATECLVFTASASDAFTEATRPLLLVAPPALAASAVARLQRAGEACCVALGIGPVGESAELEGLLAVAGNRTPHRLTLLRELAPALAESRLAVVHHRDWPGGAAMLERLAALFRGQLDFLRLAHENVALRAEIAGLRATLVALQAALAQPRAALSARLRPSVLRRLYRVIVPAAWRRHIREILGQKSNPGPVSK